jgi:hypothetical protein
MNDYALIHSETQLRRRGLPCESEGRHVTRIAAAVRPRRAKESRIRRVAVRLGDIVAGLRCQVQSRFASEPAATAC